MDHPVILVDEVIPDLCRVFAMKGKYIPDSPWPVTLSEIPDMPFLAGKGFGIIDKKVVVTLTSVYINLPRRDLVERNGILLHIFLNNTS
ncbi:MAG TPA: hypothetical protein P5550_04750 [Bacteroidales bacterium]|nr:hypothetical protein [Bacteroidales bacterium]